ncbi:shTK domain protein [Ancylostoma caninum]|uniref:ShTK domain protein n=1 Tax=Ancylostoma caninum TaxID=29170 RepID=A0A368GL57_ANCCA|nr:shTK domain protein [Ancylostoma caninum]
MFHKNVLLAMLAWNVRAQTQYCEIPTTGPCVAGTCPSPSETCITTTTGQVCCETSKVRTSSPATSTPTTCVDKVNPQTGISDCSQRVSLCNDPRYHILMTEQCPKTCGRCHDTPVTTTASPTDCFDLVNPRTGVSDCPRYAHLCSDAYYYTYMTEQCPKTCSRCPGSSVSGCRDLVNPSTGISDCSRLAAYCRRPPYESLMRVQCRRTCGFCS